MKCKNKLTERLQRLKHFSSLKLTLLISAIGVLLLLLPTEKNGQPSVAPPPEVEQSQTVASLEERMEQVLSNVDGAGRVTVMLVTEHSGLTEYQTDVEESREGDITERKTRTVFSSSADNALIKSKTEPEYRGAVIVCDGGSRAEVRLELTRAVCCLTGLSSNHVTILKMESN